MLAFFAAARIRLQFTAQIFRRCFAISATSHGFHRQFETPCCAANQIDFVVEISLLIMPLVPW